MVKAVVSGKDKATFRRSKVWKDFRIKMKQIYKVDCITHKPLSKRFQLHHLDLDSTHYTNLDMNNFVCTNPQSHEIIHILYSRYIKDPQSLDRLVDLIKRMAELNQYKDVR